MELQYGALGMVLAYAITKAWEWYLKRKEQVHDQKKMLREDLWQMNRALRDRNEVLLTRIREVENERDEWKEKYFDCREEGHP